MSTRFKGFLVADDDDALRERLAAALRNRGHRVVEAANADDVRKAAPLGPWRVLLDLRMPGAHGTSLVADLRSINTRNEVVVLTGYGSIATAVEATRLGAKEYLTKPVDLKRILASFGMEDPKPEAKKAADDTPSLDRVEWEHIQRVLSDCSGNISEAARVLKVHRRSLQRKLQRVH